MTSALLNGVLFELGWLAIVLTGGGPALAVLVGLLLLHHLLFRPSRQEWQFIALASLLGIQADLLLILSGILYTGSLLPPLWMACLWPLFATTLPHALGWLRQRYIAAALLGALGAPLAYWSGAQLTTVALATPLGLSLPIIALLWCVILPLQFKLLETLLPKQHPAGKTP